MSELRNNEGDRLRQQDRSEQIKDVLLECFARPVPGDNSLQSTAPALVYELQSASSRITILPGQVREISVPSDDGINHCILLRNNGLRLEMKKKTDHPEVFLTMTGPNGELSDLHPVDYSPAPDKGWHKLLSDETISLSAKEAVRVNEHKMSPSMRTFDSGLRRLGR